MIPRPVLGGAGQLAPSEKITLAGIGLGGQGLQNMVVFQRFLQVQVIAVCDVNREGGGYISWNWSQGNEEQKCGRAPARKLMDELYARNQPSGRYRGCKANTDYRELLDKEDVDAVVTGASSWAPDSFRNGGWKNTNARRRPCPVRWVITRNGWRLPRRRTGGVQFCGSCGLAHEIHSLGVYTNLIHPDAAERQSNLDYFEAMMRVGRHMGVRTFISEAGHFHDPKAPEPAIPLHFQDAVWPRTVATVRELARRAEPYDARILLEPFYRGFLPAPSGPGCFSRRSIPLTCAPCLTRRI